MLPIAIPWIEIPFHRPGASFAGGFGAGFGLGVGRETPMLNRK